MLIPKHGGMLRALLVLLGVLAGDVGARSAPSTPGETASARHRAAHTDVTSKGTDFMVRGHVGSFAWSDQEWKRKCKGIRTSYNPDRDLSSDELTLRPNDPRWLDFVFWSLNNKVNEHQFEAYGGTGWKGPKGGVFFHWAPGSHWERDTVHSFGFTIGHIVGEHRWTDTMFPDFFEKYGGVYGINIKDRLTEIAPTSSAPWVAFLDYIGGAGSPNYRYLLHIDSSVDSDRRLIALTAGQGVAFTYSFERYYHELKMILTDCKAVSFFEMYDRFGPGFAGEGNWAHQLMPSSALARVGYADHIRYAPELGSRGSVSSSTRPEAEMPVAIPDDLPEAERMRRGERVYFAQCIDCHGVSGDGAGFLAEGFDVKPRDFRQGKYKFRSTTYGELPTVGDVERSVRQGIPGTSMPAWGQFLTESEIEDVARYLVVFSPHFSAASKGHAEPAILPVSAVPPEVAELSSKPTGELHPCTAHADAEPQSFACDGEKLWHVVLCRECHGDGARGDGPTSQGLTDEWDNPSHPADLTYKWLFKHGHEPADVYRSIFGGLNGTAMHSYATMQSYKPLTLSVRERWALVGYVLSLSPPTRPVLRLNEFAEQRGSRIGPDGRIVAQPRGSARAAR